MFGIPSRYAVGYAVIEKSLLEGKYVVRKRHAHAWAEAFVDHQWIVVDTKPANWVDEDIEQASIFEGIQDVFNFIRHRYRLFQIGSGADNTLIFSVIVVALTAFLVLRIHRRMKIEQAGREKDAVDIRSFEGITSPFTPIIDLLMHTDIVRSENESFIDWVTRVDPWNNFDRFEFEGLYRLHLQMRYDPEGLCVEELERLRQGSEKYLAGIKKIENSSEFQKPFS